MSEQENTLQPLTSSQREFVEESVRTTVQDGHARNVVSEVARGLHPGLAGAIDRFFAKVEFSQECWLWRASINPVSGYGNFQLGGKGGPSGAHHVAHVLLIGPVPEGLVLDHLCRVRPCVNPWHVQPVTQRENVRRGASSALNKQRARLQVACLRGHPLSGENLRITGAGTRECKACRREASRKWKARARSGE